MIFFIFKRPGKILMCSKKLFSGRGVAGKLPRTLHSVKLCTTLLHRAVLRTKFALRLE